MRKFASILVLFAAGCGTDGPDKKEGMPEIWGTQALVDVNDDPKIVEVYLRAMPMNRTMADGTTVTGGYAFNGVVPGPLIQANKGDELIIHFENNLPEATTVHWHGLRVPNDMDGTPRVQDPVQPGKGFTYRFTVNDVGSYWYHPHVRSNEQVEKGLYGTLVIHDPDTEPTYDLERYLVLDDILLTGSGAIQPFLRSHPELMHGRNGNILLTNGDPSELVEADAVKGQVERWRIVNTANARTMDLSVEGAQVRIIGTDGGLLPQPYLIAGTLSVPVGRRFDLEVSYTDAGDVQLINHVPALDENNNIIEVPVPAFTVHVKDSEKKVPFIEWPVFELPAKDYTEEVSIEFNAVAGGEHGIEWQLNGLTMPMEPLFTFQKDQKVKIRLRNMAGPYHPFHLHGQFFQILDGFEPGLKDTILVPGGATREIVANFDNPGRWMAHCHILEHAELGMMSEIFVEPFDK